MKDKRIPVLSVDWDYFFPDSFDFDWGHREDKYTMFFLETVWTIRWGNKTLGKEQHIANKYYRPHNEFRTFWNTVIGNNIKLHMLAVAESHEDLYHWLTSGYIPRNGYDIYNFDAHHDAGYNNKETIDCGNWAKHFKLACPNTRYTVIYPEWRKDKMEYKHKHRTKSKPECIDNVLFGIPKIPVPLYVFICRSGAWAPSWSDPEWLEFIEWWKHKSPITWNSKTHNNYSLKARPFEEVKARKFHEEHIKTMEKHNERR